MHFTNLEATSYAVYGAEHHYASGSPQCWMPYPSPSLSQYPISFSHGAFEPHSFATSPTFPADSCPGLATAVTYQQALPLPIPKLGLQPSILTADLRHPKSYYARFRNLPSLHGRTVRATADKGAEGEIAVVEDDADKDSGDEELDEYSEEDPVAKTRKKPVKRGAGRVKRHRKTLSCEPVSFPPDVVLVRE